MTVNATALMARLREVLDDGVGTGNVIASGAYSSGVTQGMPDDALAWLANANARIEVDLPQLSRNEASTWSLPVYDVEISIRVVRVMTTLEQLSEDHRDAVAGIASQDAIVIGQALEYPANLAATSGGTATGLASGCLRYLGSTASVGRSTDDGAQPVTTIHRFSGVLV